MDEHDEDEFEEEDEDGFDPTKEAFFSDLIGMEEDIASEAYERVEHALNLIKTKYYSKLSNGYKLVGNAVPVNLAYVLAKRIYQDII